MAEASDYAVLFSNVVQVLSGNYLAVVPLAATLVDIADNRVTPAPETTTAIPVSNDQLQAERVGAIHLDIARRAAGDNSEELREAARDARNAFVEAHALAEAANGDAVDLAEIELQISACDGLIGNRKDAIYWMESAYRRSLPIALSGGQPEATRVRAYLPSLGDALLQSGSEIGYLGSRDLLERWMDKGTPFSASEHQELVQMVKQWASNGFENRPPNLDQWMSVVATEAGIAPGKLCRSSDGDWYGGTPWRWLWLVRAPFPDRYAPAAKTPPPEFLAEILRCLECQLAEGLTTSVTIPDAFFHDPEVYFIVFGDPPHQYVAPKSIITYLKTISDGFWAITLKEECPALVRTDGGRGLRGFVELREHSEPQLANRAPEGLITCPECGNLTTDDGTRCWKCGHRFDLS